LSQQIGATLHVPSHQTGLNNVQVYQGSLKDYLTSIWGQNKVFICGLATGSVVRLISHLLHDKSSDPAILVIDPRGNFVISLCSGHQGGAYHLTQLMAYQLNTTTIMTRATENLDCPGIDVLEFPFAWRKGEENGKKISSLIFGRETVQVIQ
jgi:cobalt-precorrin 5A hydrolase / precorrin-3B C17-methyltransferase